MKEGLSTQQKEADKDLNILALFTLLPLMGFLACSGANHQLQ